MAEFPKSFDDPAYDAADSSAAATAGIDPILLRSIRTRGEQSNADQVSSKGATTPYQFIPSTRKAILDKYGIDVTLNPENASLGAAYLLKEGMDRNGGDASQAVAEYHGGLDRTQHGPINRAYVSRVMEGAQDDYLDQLAQQVATEVKDAQAQPQAATPGASDDVDPLDAIAQSIADEPTMGQKAADIVTGDLRKTPETEAAPDWTQLPEYANNFGSAGWKAAIGTTFSNPEETAQVMKANFPGIEVRQDDKGNYFLKSAEDGKEYAIKPGFRASDAPRAVGSVAAFLPVGRFTSILGQGAAAGGIQGAIEGSQAATGGKFNPGDVLAAGALGALVPAASRAVSAVANRLGGGADDVAAAAARPAAPQPIPQPEVVPPASPSAARAAQDEINAARPQSAPGVQPYPMPNGLLRSVDDRTDGLTAIVPDDGMTIVHGSGNPKLTAEDIQIVRTAGQKQGKKGRVYGGLYGTAEQDAAEAAGYANMGGGTPTLYDVAIKPGTKVLNKNGDVTRLSESYINDLEKQGYGLVTGKDPRGRTEFAVIAKDAIEDFSPRPAAGPSAPAAMIPEAVQPPSAAPLAQADLSAVAKEAATGTGRAQARAQQILAEQAAPDPEMIEAYKTLGIADNFQADHVTTNQVFRELSQAIKSKPGSEARAQELELFQKHAQRADELVTELGGTKDLSTLSDNVKNRMLATVDDLEGQANKLYGDIRKAIPSDTRVTAPTTLEFIQERAKSLGGVENLTPMEKRIVAKLSPKTLTTVDRVPGRVGVTSGTTRQVGSTELPRYGLMDDIRTSVGQAARMQGPFKDADTGLAKKLYGLITADQEAAIQPFGMTETIDAAKAAVRTRKALEDDVVSLFGKNLGSSLVGNLAGGVQGLGKGDTSKFLKIINAVPKDMRQEVASSALNYGFRNGAKAGDLNFRTFAQWFEGLQQNKQAYNALMANLPKEAPPLLKALHKISSGIAASSRERITTGRVNSILKELEGPDTAMKRVYQAASKVAGVAAMEAATSTVGAPGAGLAAGITSALMKGKPDVIKAADKLISDPAFISMAKASMRGEAPKAATVKHLAKSAQMREFFEKAGKPPEMRNHEKWLMGLFQSANESQN